MKVLIKKGVKEITVNDYQAEMLLRVAPRDYAEKTVVVSGSKLQSHSHDIALATTGTDSPVIPGVTGLPKRGLPAKAKE